MISSGATVFKISKAKAASTLSANLDLARQTVEELAPVIDIDSQTDRQESINHDPEGFLSKPLVAETQVTLQEKPRRTILRQATSSQRSGSSQQSGKISATTTGNRFPFGYCTYYVAQRRLIPWSGNAITWLSGARSYGFATGDIPQVGAIVVTSEGGNAGHVAYIDAVSGNQITISEMNYRGFGVISSRTISSSYGVIKGYIY